MNMILEKFKSPSIVVSILVLCQTWSLMVAAPALPLPATYHFYNHVPTPAKRTADKGHPPAAAADWPINGEVQQVDLDVSNLEMLKQPALHNMELDLKQDEDQWHPVVEEPRDELADELRNLGEMEQSGKSDASGQPEQDDKAGYYNERQHEPEEELPQPTQKQRQREQQQIDDEILGEINKDRVETMETSRSTAENRNQEPTRAIPQHRDQAAAKNVEIPTQKTLEHISATASIQTPPSAMAVSAPSQVSNGNKSSERNLTAPQTTVDDLQPINHQEEQRELMEETPQQNEDIYNLFTNNGNRRSGKSSPTLTVVGKTPDLKHFQLSKETLLKGRNGGRYSALDLAQYVFWTGDEAGVARAIEDLIDEGLMSRESAIVFLRDIRSNIANLQSVYMDQDTPMKMTTMGVEKVKTKSVTPVKLLKQIPGTTLHSQFMATPPSNVVLDWSNYSSKMKSRKDTAAHSQQSSNGNSIENLPILMKINQMMLNRNEEPVSVMSNDNIDDTDGRLRLADYLYAEYTLEEVIYELAKVMFSQALLKGSAQAQDSLQKFIGFIEVEAGQGRISPGLHTKVIDVLMAALSDTMAEHPQLVEMARTYLGKGNSGMIGQMPV